MGNIKCGHPNLERKQKPIFCPYMQIQAYFFIYIYKQIRCKCEYNETLRKVSMEGQLW